MSNFKKQKLEDFISDIKTTRSLAHIKIANEADLLAGKTNIVLNYKGFKVIYIKGKIELVTASENVVVTESLLNDLSTLFCFCRKYTL